MTETAFTGHYQDAWVSRRFVMPLRHIKTESPLTIYGRRHMYPEHLTLRIYVNGNEIHQAVIPPGPFVITVSIPPMIRGKLEIVASDVFVPKEKGLNHEDVRELAFLLDDVVVPGLQDLMEPYHSLFDFTLSKKVYFLEDEIWDTLTFFLDDRYKVPDREMLRPLREPAWWEQIMPPPASFLRGTAYDKFSGVPVRQAEVHLYNKEKQLIMETVVNDRGLYEFDGLPAGEYLVAGKADDYGDQQIAVQLNGYGKLINIPLLPLF
jgi:hypothetical protein